MKEYQTLQRRALLAFFQAHRTCCYSIDELMEQLSGEACISRSAVYRNLDKMTREGLLTKALEPSGRKALYRYAPCEAACDRVHLRCEKCGRVMHLQSPTDESDLSALLEKSGFELDEHATVLLGLCKGCK